MRRHTILLAGFTAGVLGLAGPLTTPATANGGGGGARELTLRAGPPGGPAAADVGGKTLPTAPGGPVLGAGQALVVKDRMRDPDGAVTVRYDRTYRGLAVVGGDLLVHRTPDGRLAGVDWASHADLSAVGPVRPTVSPASARAAAVRRTDLAPAASPTLVVWAVGAQAHLAYEVPTGDLGGGQAEKLTYVDAASGHVLKSFDAVQEATASGKGKSLYVGTVPLTTTTSRGKYLLVDPTRGKGTVRAFQSFSHGLPTGAVYKDGDNVWGNGRTTNTQTAAVDAAYGVAKTWDFYKLTFGRAGIRGDGKGVNSFVHVPDEQGHPLDNAYWSDACFCMSYGDGAQVFKPLVAIDVAGHEMSHGVTSATAGLEYFGESGGLNEATSDIMGTGVEFAAGNRNDPPDYLIGEKVVKPAFGHPWLRRMDHPSLDGSSADCWEPLLGAGDPHETSGVGNHFFYTLAEGSGAKTIGGVSYNSPVCAGGSATAGIGRAKALQVWYRALTHYMLSTASYGEARDATIRAARDLYDTATCDRVVGAWEAVGVGANHWACTGTPPSNGTNVLVNPGFESGATGWTTSEAFIVQGGDYGWPPRSGVWNAVMDGYGSTHTDTLTQRVTVPSSSTARLRFYALVYSQELAGDGTSYDTLSISVTPVGGSTSTACCLSDENADNTYGEWYVDLGAWAGQTVDLRFTATEDSSAATAFLLDDLSVTPQ